MKFKLIEKFDETRDMVQDYMYDAIDELNNASLEEYIQWFKDNLTAYPEDIEQAVTDAYIEACDYGMIKGVEKTRITSELKEYIESHTDIIEDTDELMKQCPGHLQHELKIVLSKLDESLNESVLEEAIRPDLKRFIEQHAELLDENNIEELYKQCPRELKIPLVRMLNAASLSNNIEPIKRATFLADSYDDDELITLVLSVGEHANDVFDAFDYIMNNWDEFFTTDVLNEELLTEKQWFSVTHSDPKQRVKDFYLYSVDDIDAGNTLDYIYRLKSGNHAKQSFDNDVKKDLLVTYPDRSKLVVRSYSGYPNNNLISRIDRGFRHEATATVNKTKLPFIQEKPYVHHEDGKEHNQSLDNLMIWNGSDNALAHVAHIVAHDSKNYTVRPYNKLIDIYDYDVSTGTWIIVATLNVSY